MELLLHLKKFFALHGARFQLIEKSVSIKPILNWGGFENASFSISDGIEHYHLKLSREPSHGLNIYYEAAPLLEQRYRSPTVHAWIEVPGTDYAGILFESIEGEICDEFSDRQVGELSLLLQQLQRDEDVKQLLSNQKLPCSQTYLDIYDDRFTEDLGIVENARPPFVSKAVFDLMVSEAKSIKALVLDSPEFKILDDTPIHSDIWSNNVLIDKSGRLFLIDWDGLKIGDSALDYAMLLGPNDGNWSRRVDPHSFGIAISEDARKRVRLYHRAMLLDWVIDPLADWIEVARYPDWIAAIRSKNEKNHRAALETYRSLYPLA